MTTIESSYELSPIQQGMLFHHLTAGSSGVDFEQIVGMLQEDLDIPAFRRAWKEIVQRHPTMRTAFRWADLEKPLQDVYASVQMPYEEHDWRDIAADEQARRFEAYLQADRERGFVLGQPPLTRLALFRTGAETYQLVWSLHHMIMDGRSFPIALREVFDYYEAYRRNQSPTTPPTRPYRQHIDWLQARDRSGEEAFWRQLVAGFGAPHPLPIDRGESSHTRVIAQSPHLGRGACDVRLSASLTASLSVLASTHGLTLNTILQGAWGILLSRYTGEERVLFGATRAGRHTIEASDTVVGTFINTLPVAVEVSPDTLLITWLQALREQQIAVRPFEHTPLVDIHQWSDVPAGAPLFNTLIVFDHARLGSVLKQLGASWQHRDFRLVEQTNFPLTLYAYAESELLLSLAYDRDRFEEYAIERMLRHLESLLGDMVADPTQRLQELNLLTDKERHQLLIEWNATQRSVADGKLIHDLIEGQVTQTPDGVAVIVDDREITYGALNARANQLARHLRDLGVGPDVLVGLCVNRCIDMVVGLLGILKAGGAYLPLDPAFPQHRLAFMVEDSKVGVLLTERALTGLLPATEATVVCLDDDSFYDQAETNLGHVNAASDLAYVIYTSGSTGKPKGVMVEHRNVVNFFVGMDGRIDHDEGSVWLAVTSLSFDISVLELLWTLARGFTVVIASLEERDAAPAVADPSATKPIDFSLFYFASDEGEAGRDKYRLLLEGAKFADEAGLLAVWSPERHFHAFGGLYPNPSVASAAIAAITTRVQIRAGSCVLPLHHPIRVAEEWALVDNLSNGRVGIAFASGWQPNDFVLAPENYAERKAHMFESIETVRELWRGDKVAFPNAKGELVEVQTLPRPVQPELPVWVTTAGDHETYRSAGKIGANVLTHLLGQTVDDLGEKIATYHEAWREAGHAGRGKITLMLHTFIGPDDTCVRELVREPMKAYLRSSVSLVKGYASSWTAYKRSAEGGPSVVNEALDELTPEEMEGLLDYAFERYYETSGLFGTPERCLELVGKLKAADIDEIACLIDFGVASEVVLEHLRYIATVRDVANATPMKARAYRIPDQLKQRQVTHMQCTPSMARMMTMHEETRQSLGTLRQFMIGGEALGLDLVRDLRPVTQADIINMYGPTETTIWSSTHLVNGETTTIPIGRPICNTEFYVLDRHLQPLPVGAIGELYIGGAGVVRGYLNRPELTAQRFIRHPFSTCSEARLYRTGDLVRYREDGTLEFLSRVDHQVKIRGYRIELGEIEAVLGQHRDIAQVAVLVREDVPGDKRLVAYVVPAGNCTPITSELRDYLRQQLPEYMVPSSFAILDRMPLTPNRKLDRSGLPAPNQLSGTCVAEYMPPENELEAVIASIWQEVLHLSQVGIRDNFFDLGGHSLLAVQVHGKISRQTGQDISLIDMFRFPTIRTLATYMGNADRAESLNEKKQERVQSKQDAMQRQRQLRMKNRRANTPETTN